VLIDDQILDGRVQILKTIVWEGQMLAWKDGLNTALNTTWEMLSSFVGAK
jgi:hypothetical protein